jgi:hypothetical protein
MKFFLPNVMNKKRKIANITFIQNSRYKAYFNIRGTRHAADSGVGVCGRGGSPSHRGK